jgi:KilA-N domain
MNNLTFKDNDIRTKGDMVCLTDMAKPFAKRVNNWQRMEATQAYLEALSVVTLISVTLLIETSDSGTFAHPEVAIHFAQWLSPEFHVWCNINIRQFIEGVKQPSQPKSLNEILLEEVYAEVDRLAFNPTQAHGVKLTIPQYLDELDARSSHTALTGLWMALTRLKLEEGTCNPIQLHRTIHKQLRQVQIKLEGITSVHDSLLTGKELKDKSKALELNPSSKQHLLPEVPTLAH